MQPEIRAAVRKGLDHLTFDACLKAGVKEETELCLDTDYDKAFKSMPKGQEAEKAGKDKGRGKAHYDSGKCHSLQGALQGSRSSFCI
jgi:hypothetical protein